MVLRLPLAALKGHFRHASWRVRVTVDQRAAAQDLREFVEPGAFAAATHDHSAVKRRSVAISLRHVRCVGCIHAMSFQTFWSLRRRDDESTERAK
jgi:hypothetical protein